MKDMYRTSRDNCTIISFVLMLLPVLLKEEKVPMMMNRKQPRYLYDYKHLLLLGY